MRGPSAGTQAIANELDRALADKILSTAIEPVGLSQTIKFTAARY